MHEENLDWWALVGPLPLAAPTGIITVPHDRTRTLAEPCRVGPLWLRPGGRLYRDYRSLEPRQLAGVGTAESYPIIVEGAWADCRVAFPSGDLRDQQSDERCASMALHRLCCLLALAWSEGWQVRSAPQDPRTRPPEVPESWPPPPMAPTPSSPDPDPQQIPSWVGGAWEALAEDEALASALTFWHKGLLLAPEFPSFTLEAWVGSIEASARADAIRVIAESDETSRQSGAARRFWNTVGLVADNEEVDQLKAWKVWDKRSAVAHGGRTYGIETLFGSLFLLRYQPSMLGEPARIEIDEADPAQFFILRILPIVRNVAARLLYKALGARAH